MSFCNPCTITLPISLCTESITIGSISSADTAVKVYFKNIATGKVVSFETTTTSGGTVTIDSPFNFARNQSYEVWVNLASANSVEHKETISIGYDSQECLLVSFVQVWDTSAGYPVQFTNQTLEVA